MKKKVLLGMSGGVDSSVAAYLLQEQGYEVIGMTMKLWNDDRFKKTDADGKEISGYADAKLIAEKLGIKFQVINFEKSFKKHVMDYFVKAYIEGETPNPCVACNKHVKFGDLYDKAQQLGCDYIATGHYAKVEKNEQTGFYELKTAATDKKDQTYALYNLKQEQLARTLFPVGEYTKDEIRAIAAKIGMEVSNKPDSQEICFIPDDNYVRFLDENTQKCKSTLPGDFVDKDGKKLGKHKGIVHYTIGQRKGLGVTFGKPTYVIDIDAKHNRVVLGDNDDLFSKILIADSVNLIPFNLNDLKKPRKIQAKIRYSAKPAEAYLSKYDVDKIKIEFTEAQRAITKGQSVVIYNDDVVVGGGVICARK